MAAYYFGSLLDNLQMGDVIVLSGKTLEPSRKLQNRLDVTFKAAKSIGVNCPLHLSARFPENMIVRNSYCDGLWVNEERENNLIPGTAKNPIQQGGYFKIYILVGATDFHIAINDIPYCQFSYRERPETIRAIEISKDIQYIYQVDHRSIFPIEYPMMHVEVEVFNFSNDIPRKMEAGHVMIIYGQPLVGPHGQFAIIFHESGSKKQALHFNPRFNEMIVARNSHNDQLHWGFEEREGGFPFTINTPFKMAIGFTRHEFKFAVNGQYFGEFRYRSPLQLEKLDGLKVLGAQITAVDHHKCTHSPDCSGFEMYSM